MKKTIVFFLTLLLCLTMSACGKSASDGEDNKAASPSQAASETAEPSETPVSVRVGALKGPTAMGMVKMMSDSDLDNTASNQYTFSISASVDEITPAFIQGKLDIAAVPANLASVLYNKMDGKVQVLAINTLGVLYICENGTDTVSSLTDLKGKTIYASGKGATPEYALNYLLRENGLDPAKDVTVEWKSEHTECVAALTKNKDAVALLPEPFVTTAKMSNPDIRAVVDLNKEWDKVQSGKQEPGTLLTGVVIAAKNFVDSNRDAVNLFLAQYEQSVNYVNKNTEEAAKLIGRYDIIKEEAAKQALPNCNITFISGTEMKDKLSGYLNVLYNQNPQAVGGTLPDEAFYYQQ